MKKTPNLPGSDEMESALLANIRALIASARNTVARGVDLVRCTPTSKLVGISWSLSSKARAGRNTARKCSNAWPNA